jgi:hypothetical protein
MDSGIGILVCFMIVGAVGGLVLYYASHPSKSPPSEGGLTRVYREDGTSYLGRKVDGIYVESYPVQPAQPSWAPVIAAGAVGFIAGEMVERHHHHRDPHWAWNNTYAVPQPGQPAQSSPQWDAAGDDFRPYWRHFDNGSGY